MTYQGERARPVSTEDGRFFVVSKVFVDAHGHVGKVLWREVNARSDQDVGMDVVVPAADVVDAIHDGAQVAALFSGSNAGLPERHFVVIEHEEGGERIVLEGPSLPGRTLADMAVLEG